MTHIIWLKLYERLVRRSPAFWMTCNIQFALSNPLVYCQPLWSSHNLNRRMFLVISMLMTDVGDQMCWWQDQDVGDKSRCWWPMQVPQDLFKDGKNYWIWVDFHVSNITFHICHQHHILAYYDAGESPSGDRLECHQHTFLSPT